MKRHPALAPLSREHHSALLLCQLLKKDAPPYKGLPDNVADKAVYAVNFFTNNLLAHFKKEEEMLARVISYHIEIESLAAEIVKEHQQLSIIFNSFDKAENLVEILDRSAKELEQHIRKEERILFPLIQQYCPQNMLETIEL